MKRPAISDEHRVVAILEGGLGVVGRGDAIQGREDTAHGLHVRDQSRRAKPNPAAPPPANSSTIGAYPAGFAASETKASLRPPAARFAAAMPTLSPTERMASAVPTRAAGSSAYSLTGR